MRGYGSIDPSQRTEKHARRPYRAALLALGALLFVYVFVRLGAAEISSLVLGIGWYFVPIVAVYFGHQLVRAFAYSMCVTAKVSCSYWEIVRIKLSGEALQFLTSTGPFLAEPAKVWLLRQQGLSAKEAVAATMSEYLIYMFTSAALAVGGLSYLLRNFALHGATAAAANVIVWTMAIFLIVAAFAILGRVYLIGAIINGASRLPRFGKLIRIKPQDLRDTEDLLFPVLRDRPLRFFSILAIECGAQALLILELYLFLQTTMPNFPALYPALIECAAKFIGLAFFFVPGQVGASESAYAIIFETVGLAASAGFALAVARRVRSLLVAGMGLALVPRWKKPKTDRVVEHEAQRRGDHI